jgi:nitrate/nitrite transporter NarK
LPLFCLKSRMIPTATRPYACVGASWFAADASFPALLAAGLGSGVAGGCSAVGLSYMSYIMRWYPREGHGTALALFAFGRHFMLIHFGQVQTSPRYSFRAR